MFPVSPHKAAMLKEKMERLGVREEEIEEQFTRSGGPGGQHVNKTSTCVILVHRPTGISVRCQEERSQALNRFLARRMLLDRIEARQRGFVQAERDRVERIRRQKRRRSRRSRQKSVEDKRHRSGVKSGRGPVSPGD